MLSSMDCITTTSESKFLVHTGVALLRAGRVLDKLKGENEDQRHGVEMVKKALSWPARQIAINAGEDGSVVVGKIQDNDTYAFGFDAQTGKFENLVSTGSLTRPRWSAQRRRMRPRLPACSSLPRRWWPRCRRSNRRRLPCPAVAWVAWITERRSESASSRERIGSSINAPSARKPAMPVPTPAA